MHDSSHCVDPSCEDDNETSAFSLFKSTNSNPSSVNIPDDLEIYQDETSFRVTVEMEGVKGRDITISVQDGLLTISGYRRSSADCRQKKQRLERRIPVDTSVVDISRAMANIWKNTLVLYAPKKPTRVSVPFTEELDYEFSTPGADRLVPDERAARSA